MPKKLTYLHTVAPLVGLFNDLSREMLPGDVGITHILDEMLAKTVLAQGGLTPFIYRRVADHVMAAEEAGADIVQITCSSVSPCAGVVGHFVSIPVLRIDEPMVNRAVSAGTRIGVLATAPTALAPVAELVQVRAAALGKKVEVSTSLCADAYAALFTGQPEAHDRMVREALVEMLACNDVVLLTQASTARAADSISDGELRARVLTSPRLAVARLREVLNEVAG
ncbi:MAG: Asp/Glu/hydantoin racemase [Anaerolineae bacterium]|nr:Asp/Glu/hydantoin racemase [Anaerolineae bacterium]